MALIRLTEEGDRRLMAAFAALREERANLARTFREVDQTFRETLRAGDS